MIDEAFRGRTPLYRRVLGRPSLLAVYRELYGKEPYGFLYESLEAHGTRGRYSFLGGRPRVIFRSKGDEVHLRIGEQEQRLTAGPLDILRRLIRSGEHALPVSTFPGGAVGYAGYDIVRSLSPVPRTNPDDLGLPDMFFVFPEELLIFDHLDEVVHMLHYGDGDREARLDAIERQVARLESTASSGPEPDSPDLEEPNLRSNMTREAFSRAVEQAKEHIRAGDILQVVLSQRFEFPLRVDPFDVYCALRRTNPSPYMYYLNLDGIRIAGSSPEILVKLTGRRVVTRPLAGTRPRGETAEADRGLADELLADDKERAEHVMLVDLARNDIGRDCVVGSVQVEDYLGVERYARVMHLVSNVLGRLRDDRDAFDLFASTFPAGTVSGAPKVRAMQIIEDLEPLCRGPYAGAIGYFSFLGDMDMCIAIRTIVCHGDRGFLQVGAGIVADSQPDREYEETLNKARAVVRAIGLAERLAAG